MPIRRGDVRKLVKEAIIAGIRSNGDRIFSLSQNTEACYVPVDKGILKHSGYVKSIRNGVEIGYVAPYSARVERGGPAIPYTGTQEVHIRAHRRSDYTTKKGIHVRAANVKAHDKKYENKRLIGFRPKFSKFERGPLIFRVLKEEPAREGQFFLARAVEKEITKLPDDIGFHLKKLERAV